MNIYDQVSVRADKRGIRWCFEAVVVVLEGKEALIYGMFISFIVRILGILMIYP